MENTDIRFINSDYKRLFNIPNGSNIGLRNMNSGEISDCVCKYIDENHFVLEHRTYHIREFAEKMKMNNICYYPLVRELSSNLPLPAKEHDGFSIQKNKDNVYILNSPAYEQIAEHMLSVIPYNEQNGYTAKFYLKNDAILLTKKGMAEIDKSAIAKYYYNYEFDYKSSSIPFWIISKEKSPVPIEYKDDPDLLTIIKESDNLTFEKTIFRKNIVFKNANTALDYLIKTNNNENLISFKDENNVIEQQIGTRRCSALNIKELLSTTDTKRYNFQEQINLAAEYAKINFFSQRRNASNENFRIYYRTPLGNQIFSDVKISNKAVLTENGYSINGQDEYDLLIPRKIPSTLKNKDAFEYIKDIIKSSICSVNPNINYDFSEKPLTVDNKTKPKRKLERKDITNDYDIER